MKKRTFTSLNSQKGILQQRYIRDLQKELFRKVIHLCSLFVPVLLFWNKIAAIIVISLLLFAYSLSEILRLKGFTIPFFTAITMAAARKRDENHFVLGPVTLCSGILVSVLFFNPICATIGICALALGDGFASIAGKFLGKERLPFLAGKTAAGSLACFFLVFLSTLVISKNTAFSLIIAFVGMIVEMIPLKDWDNLCIPVITAAFAQYFLQKGF